MHFTSDGDPLFAQIIDPVREHERAATVMLLHPTPLDHRFWLPVARRLPTFRLVLPDLRGHGQSALGEAAGAGTGAATLTMTQLARDAVALLDAMGIKRAIFVGCSIGGYTLYELWRSFPARMAAAVFASSKPEADTATERAKRKHWIATHAEQAGSHPTEEFVDTMLAALLAPETRKHRPTLIAELRSTMELVSPGTIQAIQKGLAARPDSRPSAASFTIPTCVIAGECDTGSTPESLFTLRSLLATQGAPSAFHLLPQAGHYAPVELPDATACIIADFCRLLVPESAI